MDGTVTVRTQHADGDLIVERTDAIARVIFNRPERMNAMTLASWEALAQLTHAFSGDPSLRVFTFEGAGGRAFVSGADISEFDDIRSRPDAAARYNEAVHAALDGIAKLPVPSLALINGYCIGGGLEIALSCDIRIASDTSTFALTPAKLGLGFGYAGTELIARVAGAQTAADLIFSGRRVPAREALTLRLCERLFASENFEEEARAAAQEIASNAPLTIRAVKAALIDMRRPRSQRNQQSVDRLVAACTESQDYREGRRAFAEKRNPEFKGC